MPGLSNQFTDNNLKVFYSNLLAHYQDCIKRYPQPNINEIYNEMIMATQYAVDFYNGQLYHLEPQEKAKVYQAFNAIFYALPLYRELQPNVQQAFRPVRPPINVNYVYVQPTYYYNYNDTLLTWMLLSSMTHNCRHSGPIYTPSSSSGPIHSHPSTNSSNGKSNDDMGKLIAALILIVIVAAAAALAFIALFYMIHQFANSVERLWYHEGWLKAALMLATSVAFGALSSGFALTVASAPLIALAIAAGFNPIGVLIIGAVCLTLMGAGLACFVTSLIYDSIEEKSNNEAMDSFDPSRFRLTVSEEQALMAHGIDPMKVKCAMVALRAEMSKELDNEKAIPSFFSRHFGNGSKVQPLLNKVRALRSGAISEVSVGDLTFDCRITVFYQIPQNNVYPNSYVPSASSDLDPPPAYGYGY